MICMNCGYSPLDVHRTSDATITYCQNCSANSELPVHEHQQPVADILEAKQKKQKQKLMDSLSPAARKRLRVG